MTPDQAAHIMPPLPEWSKCDDLGGLVPSEIRQELRAYARAAVEAALRDAPQWPPCRGVPRAGCNYLAACDTVCNKCGQVHRFPDSFAPSAPTAVEPTAEDSLVVEPDEWAELIVQAGEEMSFEAWFKTMCPVDGINAKIAARAAWQARASKGTK